MSDWLNLTVALIPLLPLLAVLWIAVGFVSDWNRGEAGEAETTLVSVGAAGLSFLLLLGLDIYSLLNGAPGTLPLGNWLDSGTFRLDISFLLDGLSLNIASWFSLIILLTTQFSVNYLHREAGYQRFFMLLSLFNAAMMLIVLGGNLLLVFVGWELAGLSSYLLIAFVWQRNAATDNATRAFVTNRIGEAGFLLALFIALAFLGSGDWQAIFSNAPSQASLLVGALVFGLTLAALVKSAQFPFSGWITRALEGPTPSSALFYGAVMVHAGIYLLLRSAPLLEMVPLMGWALMLIGSLTVVYAWVSAQVQTDIKSSLIFATLMQTGLMVVEIGLGWYTLATVHLILHALWRAYQFLHAPSFMQQTQWPAPPAPAWLCKRPWLYMAALQRFWLDPLADWLLVRPTRLLANEAQLFDEHVVNRITGTPTYTGLAHLQTAADNKALNGFGVGSGLFGHLMQRSAESLEWFEDKLVMSSGSEGLSGLAGILGKRAEQVENHLREPRYLLVLIAATMVVIL